MFERTFGDLRDNCRHPFQLLEMLMLAYLPLSDNWTNFTSFNDRKSLEVCIFHFGA